MAISIDNIIVRGLHGKIGNQLVIRGVNGRTIVSNYPRKSSVNTEKQQEQKQKFRKASAYARAVMKDSVLKEKYVKAGMNSSKKLSGYAMAVKDFLVPDEVYAIDKSDYSGQMGGEILFYVSYVLEPKNLSVKILNGGSVVESGDASFENGVWIYRATKSNSSYNTCKFEVTLIDHRGNDIRVEF